MRCKECSNELTLIEYRNERSKVSLYGACFSCDEIFHIKKKKTGRSKMHHIQPQHIPREVFLTLKR